MSAPNGPAPVRTIAFNALPATTRQRFCDAVSGRSPQRPILSQPSLTVGAGVGWLFTSVFGLLVAYATMYSASQGRYSQSWTEGPIGLLFIAAAMALAFFGVFAAVERYNAKSALRSGNRVFVGIIVDFSVSMRVPGAAQPFTFTTSVQPPERFSFSYESNIGASAGPSDGRVYSVMAERAFAQLSAHMAGVFFRPGSDAHRLLQGSSGALHADDSTN